MRCAIPKFPERLKALIDNLGVTQSEFSARIGVTEAAISQFLSGKSDPAASTLVKLNKATGVSIDHLLGIKP